MYATAERAVNATNAASNRGASAANAPAGAAASISIRCAEKCGTKTSRSAPLDVSRTMKLGGLADVPLKICDADEASAT